MDRKNLPKDESMEHIINLANIYRNDYKKEVLEFIGSKNGTEIFEICEHFNKMREAISALLSKFKSAGLIVERKVNQGKYRKPRKRFYLSRSMARRIDTHMRLIIDHIDSVEAKFERDARYHRDRQRKKKADELRKKAKSAQGFAI